MNCSKKNPRYKSVGTFVNPATQSIGATATPLSLLGTQIVNSGIALDVQANGVEIDYTGIFDMSVTATVLVTTAGVITLQLYVDNVPIPDSLVSVTTVAGRNVITSHAIRFIRSTEDNNPIITVVANTDGTAVGSIILLSGSVYKLG